MKKIVSTVILMGLCSMFLAAQEQQQTQQYETAAMKEQAVQTKQLEEKVLKEQAAQAKALKKEAKKQQAEMAKELKKEAQKQKAAQAKELKKEAQKQKATQAKELKKEAQKQKEAQAKELKKEAQKQAEQEKAAQKQQAEQEKAAQKQQDEQTREQKEAAQQQLQENTPAQNVQETGEWVEVTDKELSKATKNAIQRLKSTQDDPEKYIKEEILKKYVIEESLECPMEMRADLLAELEEIEGEADFKGFNLSIQGGMLFSMNENSWTYYKDKKSWHPAGELAADRKKLGYGFGDLFTPQASLTVGYDFGHAFGIRLQGNIAKNASAGNHNQQPHGGFYPYTFNTASVFADAVFNISGFVAPEKQHRFETKIYAGLGAGYSYKADTKYLGIDKNHLRYGVEMHALTFGFRGGIIEEIFINDHMGAFIDLNLESYTDKFNGYVSYDTEYDKSFPYDLRIVGSLGIIRHF